MKHAHEDLATRDYIATQVRMELARKRISVSEAARRLGWGQTVLQRRVVGQRPFEAAELAQLARLLEVPIERFYPEDLNRDLAGIGPASDIRTPGFCRPLAAAA